MALEAQEKKQKTAQTTDVDGAEDEADLLEQVDAEGAEVRKVERVECKAPADDAKKTIGREDKLQQSRTWSSKRRLEEGGRCTRILVQVGWSNISLNVGTSLWRSISHSSVKITLGIIASEGKHTSLLYQSDAEVSLLYQATANSPVEDQSEFHTVVAEYWLELASLVYAYSTLSLTREICRSVQSGGS